MTPENFCYWLQGSIELDPYNTSPTDAQWAVIKNHLAEVFIKITPEVDFSKIDFSKINITC